MNYQLSIAIFTKEMGKIPIRLTTNIPESLAKALMNTTVLSSRFAIAQNVKPFTIPTIPLDKFNTEGIFLPDRIDKRGHIS